MTRDEWEYNNANPITSPGNVLKRKPMNAQDKQHLESLTHSARIVVRETGNVAAWAENSVDAGHPMHRNMMHAYDMACAHLIQLDPAGAAEFIKSTYGPAFRQTVVTK